MERFGIEQNGCITVCRRFVVEAPDHCSDQQVQDYLTNAREVFADGRALEWSDTLERKWSGHVVDMIETEVCELEPALAAWAIARFPVVKLEGLAKHGLGGVVDRQSTP